MSHEPEKHEDNGTELKRLFDEVQSEASINKPSETDETPYPPKTERQIDVLNLPPRTEVHSGKKDHARIKINHAMLRFIFVIIILVLVLGGSFFLWGEEILKVF
ncbi:hypothetical protein GCM10009001_15020 [Virgibacillus siamensis]|uniref:Uncharacterized protein n=1 Tax=Virgibacillus siamensis TaxID=480071 RepID=A0ABN1FX85_9BACI